MSEDVFDCHSWGTGCCWHLVVEARDVGQCLKMCLIVTAGGRGVAGI